MVGNPVRSRYLTPMAAIPRSLSHEAICRNSVSHVRETRAPPGKMRMADPSAFPGSGRLTVKVGMFTLRYWEISPEASYVTSSVFSAGLLSYKKRVWARPGVARAQSITRSRKRFINLFFCKNRKNRQSDPPRLYKNGLHHLSASRLENSHGNLWQDACHPLRQRRLRQQ